MKDVELIFVVVDVESLLESIVLTQNVKVLTGLMVNLPDQGLQ